MRPWDHRTAANWWTIVRHRRATGRTRRDPLVYPHALRYARHAEFGCHSLVPGATADGLIRHLAEAQQAGGNFCLAAHYWEIDATLKTVMRAVLDFAARQPDVRFVAAEELFA
jgi:hypothetical protein